MRAVLVLLAGCGFQVGVGAAVDAPDQDDDDAPTDADDDAATVAAVCPAVPDLRLCWSFDQPEFLATAPNEGVATVDAQLRDVTRVARTPASGAAMLGATSSIFVPMSAAVIGILSIEIWFRATTLPSGNGSRMGLVDSNVIPPNISLFFYREGPGYTLRCGIGSQTEVWPAALVAGTWHHAVCTCDGGSLQMYLDGAKIGDTAGPCATAGAVVGDGFTIGSDNTGNGPAVGDRLAGEIDAVRIWSAPRSAAQILAAVGGP